MTTSMVAEVNCTTGEVTEREMTAEEIAANNAANENYLARKAEAAAEAEALSVLKASAKAKLVAGQPLTEAEAATLIL
jgi:hypothetical protein